MLGKKSGLEGKKSGLFYKYIEILNFVKQKNSNIKFLLENVQMNKKWEMIISNYMGVSPVLIDSALVSAQRRKRLFWCNWKVTIPEEKNIQLKDVVLGEYDNSYFLSQKHYEGFMKSYKWKHCELDGKASTLLSSYYKQPPHCPYIKCMNSPSGYRRLSPCECELLMTLPLNYTEKGLDGKKISDTQRYKAIGNGWTVDVIAHIIQQLYCIEVVR